MKSTVGGSALTSLTVGIASANEVEKGSLRVADLTHVLHQDFPTFVGHDQFFVERTAEFSRDGYNMFELRYAEHVGTHVDAPLHFSGDGASVSELPVDKLVAPLCIVDIRKKSRENADAQVTPDDLKAWISKHGEFPQGACVAMNSGWDVFARTLKFRNADDRGVMHFPGFHAESTEMLMQETGALAIGVDTLSLDYGQSTDFAVHQSWLPSNRFGVECLANLGQLPESGATIIVGAPKHQGGTGGPARILALM